MHLLTFRQVKAESNNVNDNDETLGYEDEEDEEGEDDPEGDEEEEAEDGDDGEDEYEDENFERAFSRTSERALQDDNGDSDTETDSGEE